jgi:ABC-2 type transport system permease protein
MTTSHVQRPTSHALSKYAAFARVGFAEARAEPGELYARVAFLVVILGVLSALWRAVGASATASAVGAGGVGDRATMVWYIAMTEWVLMSAPLLHFDIEAEVRRGDVAYQIARPVSYVGAHVARGVGALVFRAPVLLVAACATALVFAGPPPSVATIAGIVAIGVAAAFVMSAWYAGLGLLAFWLGDIAPVYWIWQKLTFVLGGLLLPLTFYPRIVMRIATVTPFPALLTGPASFVLARPLYGTLELIAWQALWLIVAIAVALLLFRRATRTLQLNGG